jgi:peptidoglycan/LPS O-acetylase OafA/YrhL
VVVTVTGVIATAGWFAAMNLGWINTGLHTAWLPTYYVWFSTGMALAIASVALRTGTAPARWRVLDDLGSTPTTAWAIALGLLAVASTPVAGPRGLGLLEVGELATKIALFLLAAMMVFVATAFGPDNRYKSALRTPGARWLGTISYGIFLWHPVVLEGIHRLSGRRTFTGDFLSTFLLTVAGSVVIAAISYYALERPLLRWGKKDRSRGGAPDHRKPQRGDGEQAERLRTGGPVGVIGGQRPPPAGEQQDGRKPEFQRT